MKNRSLYAVLTRFGIVGAVLTAVLLIGSVASAQGVNSDAHEYAENSDVAMVPVGTYSAVDPEGEGVEYGVNDEDNFEISEEGVLSFKESPDFEAQDEYKVTVTANDADLLEVTITITNMEEDAVVTVAPPRPQIGNPVMASVEDEDGDAKDQMWSWERSPDMMEWTPIDDATQSSYTPESADDEMYLRATVSYIDPATSEDDASTEDVDESRDTASGVSEKTVEANPNANAAPKFAPDVDHDDDAQTANIYRITIKENAKGAIGEDPIEATDADNDVLLYSLTEASPRDDGARFEIDERSGQISVTSGTVLNASTDTEITGGNNETDYDVTVTATDPSGAPGTVMVNIVVTNVDEAPDFDDGEETELTIGEDSSTDDNALPDENLGPPGSLNYNATDPDADSTVTYDLSGADAGAFDIGESSGDLSLKAGEDAPVVDYETQKEYKITIEAKGAADSTAVATLDVTVKVTNVDEDGMVMMTARQPQVGKSVTASVMDPDGDVSELTWLWASQASDTPADANATCPEAVGGNWVDIDGATTASYTPDADDATMCLRATASYKDGAEAAVDERTPAVGVSDRAVEVKPAANDAPVFADDEEPTGADPVELEVDENTTGKIADAIITATDPNNDLMLYSLVGDDADSFDIVEMGMGEGQLSVADGTMLDYESDKKTYSFMVKATDPSGANNTVNVTITLKPVDEDPKAPEGAMNLEKVDYAENSDVAMVPVGTYSAVDPEGEDVKYGVSDEDNFAITEDGGVLTFKESPDFEAQDEYKVTVTANDADLLEVTITITNMEEDAVVTVAPPRPQIGKPVMASVEDEDGGEDDHIWSWARSSDMMEWTPIDDATQSSYTPESADENMYLQATVSYIDAATSEDDASTADVDESRDTASGVSEKKVEANPDANKNPKFAPDVDHDDDAQTANIYRITIKENAKGAIGEDPIEATDADNDVLLYSLTEASPRDDGARFEIDERSGQISVTSGTVLNASTDTEITGGNNETDYDVTVTATDPSGAPGTVMVNIVVTNVDEAPDFDDGEETELTIGEDSSTDDNALPDENLGPPGSLNYNATDPDADSTVTYDLSGADAGAFDIGESSGDLSLKAGEDAPVVDYETQKEYKITIEAKGAADSTAVATLDVTVKVTNVDEDGMVMMTARQPQVGKSVTASVMDPDGDVSELTWLWASQASDTPADANATCPEAVGGNWVDIDGATTASYTPDADDATMCLRATASYKDGAEAAVDERTPAVGVSDRAVEVKPAANDAPVFADDEEPTGADPVELEVDEKTTGKIADAIITATDPNNDLMMYSLVGDDADSFDIVEMGMGEGQLSVAEGTDLDYESDKKTYSFMVKATDPSGADGTVDVTITLKPVDEPPELNMPPEFDGETAERNVAENTAAGEDIGEPITATDENTGDSLTYSLDAMGDMSFDIDDMGQITVGEGAMLDHETMASHTVTVTAMDTGRLTATITVTITVGDENEAPTFDALQAELMAEVVELNVDENTPADMAFGDPVAAMDVDADDTLTYELGGDDAASFAIDAATGQLMTEAALDHEMQDSYSVTVTATDSGDLNDAIGVTIAVGDMNEAPVFASDMVMISVNENTPAGDIGDPIAATDEDEGATLTYELGGDDAASFAIDPATGQLMTIAALDHETKSSYTLTVTVTDGEHSAEITVMVTVGVDNVNEAPVFGEGDSAGRNVDENTEAGENIGDPVTATDEDVGDTLTYSLDEMGDMSFDIDPATGQLMTEAALDYESGTTSYDVTVTATDSGGLYAMIAVTIAVNDVPETPVFDADAIEFPVDENMYAGTAVGTVTAIHAESYSDDLDYFDVDDMGNITTTMMFDYEGADTSFMGTVTATGADGSTDTIAVTVTVGDAHPGCTMAGNMGLTNDCEALLDAKGDLGGDLNWDTDTAMADWEGVTMSDGRVSEVWLKGEGLDGSVSAAFGRLDMLTLLNLHTNSLSGSIPDLSGATMLEGLYLPNNDLTGGIPAWLNGSTNLTNLWLWGNQLTGGIPDLSGLTNLDMLKLANNDLSGEINAAYLPQNVSWLIIDRNGFSGDIPDLSGLTSLELLWLHTNELTGSVPNGTMLPASLDDLNLRDNMLMGAIPDLSALDNLTRLRLHNNSLSGAVPGSLGGLDSLKQLWLHNEEDSELGNNMFTSIDDGVGGLSDTLIEIQLGGNPWADDACVPADLADVATNDYEAAGIAVCGADDGS